MANGNQVVDILLDIAQKIDSESNYITKLDQILGDGDHWANMHKGYQKLTSMEEELRTLTLEELFKKVGFTMMSTIGGSSGILYGDAMLSLSRVVAGVDTIDLPLGLKMLEAALNGIMKRGGAAPGDKTMIDPLDSGYRAYKKALESGAGGTEVAEALQKGAEQGAAATKEMKAQKGRATYRQDKGVGYIDAGAMTLFYHLDLIASHMMRYRTKEFLMKIENSAKIKNDQVVNGLRTAIDHRATWMGLIFDEIRKEGVDPEPILRNAILRCGHLHGAAIEKRQTGAGIPSFEAAFLPENTKKIFEMDVKVCNNSELFVEFNYCPLVAAWEKLGFADKDLELLCDCAMEGDRGIAQSVGYTFELGKTIAAGDSVCEVRFKEKKGGNG